MNQNHLEANLKATRTSESGKAGSAHYARRDVERHAEAKVGGALVHLAAQLAVCDEKLAEHVARRQGHHTEIGRNGW